MPALLSNGVAVLFLGSLPFHPATRQDDKSFQPHVAEEACALLMQPILH